MGGYIDDRRIKELSEHPQPERSLLATWLNPQLSVYWLWFTVFFGGIAVLPWYSEDPPNLAGAYIGQCTIGDWRATLMVHTLIALVLAVPVAARHAVSRRLHNRAEPTSFALRKFLLGTGLFALIFGGLGSMHAPPVAFAFVLLTFSGWPVTLILAGMILRRERRRQKTSP